MNYADCHSTGGSKKRRSATTGRSLLIFPLDTETVFRDETLWQLLRKS